ncbi:MAG: tryptophan-rich sensory protein [Anaerolineae bacterium]|nr:tryptophan-rich sensory protein [Anaerolineae bacterium]
MQLRSIANIASLIITLLINYGANSFRLNGYTAGDVSDSIPSLFTPAGYVFSIWGLIYSWLIAYSIYQVLPRQQDAEFQRRIGWLFVLSNLFNGAWIFAWHYLVFPLSLVLIVGVFGSLLAIYLRLGIGRRAVSKAEKWLVHVPFSIYLGWLSVATIANTSIMLYDLGWNGFGIPEFWTALVIAVGAGLGVAMTLLRREVAYPLVIVWAFVGIVVSQAQVPLVAWTAGLGALAVVVALIVSRLRKAS